MIKLEKKFNLKKLGKKKEFHFIKSLKCLKENFST